ncbi:MAG: hypothetical protein Q8O67_31700 [Deltaproteobacteria bacterium]|nr:hypothetical protein [Deltaproteobacteria bacterium]
MSNKTVKQQIRARLEHLVHALGPEATAQITLVGGSAPALYLFDTAVKLRPTGDVDVVLAVSSLAAWHHFIRDLEEKRSFRASKAEDAPVCRYIHNGLVVDIMTTGEHLGFGNKWYDEAIDQRVESDEQRPSQPSSAVALGPFADAFVACSGEAREAAPPLRLGLDEIPFAGRRSTDVTHAAPGLHVIQPIYFLATKFGAFKTRGKDWSSTSWTLIPSTRTTSRTSSRC